MTQVYDKGVAENWKHDAGRVCFNRTIDPALYPAITPGMMQIPSVKAIQ
jgi:hypothetical protein